MTDREAIKMAFDTFVNLPTVDEYGSKEEIISKHTTMTMLRQALAQPEQEPVGWMLPDYGDVLSASEADGTGIYNIPLYTAPPKREWVGLTIEEIKEMLYGLHGDDRTPMLTLVNVVEAKLKQKNAVPTAQTGNTQEK